MKYSYSTICNKQTGSELRNVGSKLNKITMNKKGSIIMFIIRTPSNWRSNAWRRRFGVSVLEYKTYSSFDNRHLTLTKESKFQQSANIMSKARKYELFFYFTYINLIVWFEAPLVPDPKYKGIYEPKLLEHNNPNYILWWRHHICRGLGGRACYQLAWTYVL